MSFYAPSINSKTIVQQLLSEVMNLHFHAWDNIFSAIKKQKVPPESKAFTFKRDVFQYDCYDSMNPVLLPEKQGTTILLQLHVSIQQSGELLLYRYPLFALILSAVHPFAAGWISDIPAASGSPQNLPSWKAPASLPVPAPG